MPASPPSPVPAGLETPLTSLRGVGTERAAQLDRLGLRTVNDLLLHAPRRYEDRRHLLKIRELKLGESATTRGRIVATGVKTYQRKTRSVYEFVLEDGTGRLHCRWWNLPFMEKYFAVGDEVMAFGKVKPSKPRTMDHPETEVLASAGAEGGDAGELSIHLDRIAPIYPSTEGLPQRWLRALVWRALEQFGALVTEPWPGLKLDGWPGRAESVRMLHFPVDPAQPERARRRLALDECIDLQLAIQRRRRNLQANAKGIPCGGDNRLVRPFLRELAFELTGAQTRVLRELRKDLSGPFPMRRLVQGDVGSGKTVVAACCALMTLESGFNVALMAPTEILAGQHFATFRKWFEPLGVRVELQTGSRKTADVRSQSLSENVGQASSLTVHGASVPRVRGGKMPPEPADKMSAPHFQTASQKSEISGRSAGETTPAVTHLTIGTHALIEAGFEAGNLGLVIIDEQHKFGVAQRETLVKKGRYPHLLVMTATPIPRTLGLTLYGDLDTSVIDELPPGRGRIRTFVRTPAQLSKVEAFIRQKIEEGRQAYVVYPRVEEGDAFAGIKAVKEELSRLEKTFAPHRVGLMHGRLSSDEKERVMNDFRAGRVMVLLATTVIEVGVDVPNATMMLIESADQFGLAQLHQLRGRVGRGAHESYCILVGTTKTPDAKERLRVMESTQDGFEIAEADLRLRGPGELLGQQQSGLPEFRFANLAKDRALIEQARELAAAMLKPQENLNPPSPAKSSSGS